MRPSVAPAGCSHNRKNVLNHARAESSSPSIRSITHQSRLVLLQQRDDPLSLITLPDSFIRCFLSASNRFRTDTPLSAQTRDRTCRFGRFPAGSPTFTYQPTYLLQPLARLYDPAALHVGHDL